MRLGRLVPAAAYRMRRSGSEWSRSRKSLPAHGHESWPCRGHIPARVHLRRREPAPSPAVEHAAVRHLRACRRDARPRRAGRHLHPLAHLPDAPWHHQPGGRAARRRGRRQRLRPARLRGPMPAARRRASLPLRGPRIGHLAGAWQQERGGRIWTPASAVTCWAGANWSPPTGAPERSLPAPASPIRPAGARSQP